MILRSLLCLVILTVATFAEKRKTSSKSRTKKPSYFRYLKSYSRDYKDKDGYIIVTTKDLAKQLNSLGNFVEHKAKNRGFNVFLATESQFDKFDHPEVQKAVERGESKSRIRQYQLLNFLKDHYKRLNLKYVLFIGTSAPETGEIPMIYTGHKPEGAGKAYTKHAWHSPSDYPYADLDTDWDHNDDGYFDMSKEANHAEVNKGKTREAEVFVGRVPYYGEDSKYGKADDVDVILERFIRYDNEKDISWRYNFFISKTVHMGAARKRYEDLGINYRLADRHTKNYNYDFPGEEGANGRVSNYEKVSTFPTGAFGEYSHGGPTRMNGMSSRGIAGNPKDFYPSIMTLGACSIGEIEHQENLVYTLLRFNTVAASGGTRSVTNYGGDNRYVVQNGLTKDALLLKGKSVGEAHWGWYGGLYKRKGTPNSTTRRINLYGDPSVIPFRNGAQPTYPFIAKPVLGHFVTYEPGGHSGLDRKITINNTKNKAIQVKLTSNKEWLRISKRVAVIPAKGKLDVTTRIYPSAGWDLKARYQEARITIQDRSTKYSTERRMGYYQTLPETGMFIDFNHNDMKENYHIHNLYGSTAGGGHNAAAFSGAIGAARKWVIWEKKKVSSIERSIDLRVHIIKSRAQIEIK